MDGRAQAMNRITKQELTERVPVIRGMDAEFSRSLPMDLLLVIGPNTSKCLTGMEKK